MQYVEGFDRVRRTICNAFVFPIQMIEMNDSGITLGGGGAQFCGPLLSSSLKPSCRWLLERQSGLLRAYCLALVTSPVNIGLSLITRYRGSKVDGGRDTGRRTRGNLESNEARAERGLEPLPDGNGLRVNGQRVDLLDKVTSQPKVDPNKPKPSRFGKTLEVVARCKKVTTYFRHSLAGNGKAAQEGREGSRPISRPVGARAALAAQMADFYNSVNWTVEDGKVTLDQKKERERLEVILLLFLTRRPAEYSIILLDLYPPSLTDIAQNPRMLYIYIYYIHDTALRCVLPPYAIGSYSGSQEARARWQSDRAKSIVQTISDQS